MKGVNYKWTPELDEIVRREYPENMDLEGLAKQLGVTMYALRTRAKVLRVFRKALRYWSPAQIQRLREEWPTTRYPRVLAAELGKSYHCAFLMAKRHGIHRQAKAYKSRGLKGYDL